MIHNEKAAELWCDVYLNLLGKDLPSHTVGCFMYNPSTDTAEQHSVNGVKMSAQHYADVAVAEFLKRFGSEEERRFLDSVKFNAMPASFAGCKVYGGEQ